MNHETKEPTSWYDLLSDCNKKYGAIVLLAAVSGFWCDSSFSATEQPGLADRKSLPNIADWLESNTEMSLFTEALRMSSLWTMVQSTEKITLFVPSNHSLRLDGSDFLIEGVLLAKENRKRLDAVLGYHILLGENIDAKFLPRLKNYVSSTGDCSSISEEEGRVVISFDTQPLDRIVAKNGTLYIIDRLLWTPYKSTSGCVGSDVL